MAVDILLIPLIILFNPVMALLATFIPKSAAALPISEPIFLMYFNVLSNHDLKPLYVDFALLHPWLEILLKFFLALPHISVKLDFAFLYVFPNHLDADLYVAFVFSPTLLAVQVNLSLPCFQTPVNLSFVTE
ncbi:Uncharacterised protein [Staphylococcus aureus]|nr:Uncharacterised protein [Staphylococcus aureus]